MTEEHRLAVNMAFDQKDNEDGVKVPLLKSENFWTGINDLETEGSWKFSNGNDFEDGVSSCKSKIQKAK